MNKVERLEVARTFFLTRNAVPKNDTVLKFLVIAKKISDNGVPEVKKPKECIAVYLHTLALTTVFELRRGLPWEMEDSPFFFASAIRWQQTPSPSPPPPPPSRPLPPPPSMTAQRTD